MSTKPYWAIQAKKRMKELGITQLDLMDVFGVTTRGAVGHYFTGRAVIDIEQLKKLSEFLGVRLEYCEPEFVKSTLTIDQLSMLLNKWLVKLEQLGFAEYSIEVGKIKNLIISDVIDDLPKKEQKQFEKLLRND